MGRAALRRPAQAGALLSFLALLVAPILPGATGGVALGHAQLVASSPSAGEIVATPPTELRLVFSEPLESEFTSAAITTDDGSVIVSRGGSVDPTDRFQLVLELPHLADGIYVVEWRTLSAADGHTAEGFLSFGVGDTGGVAPTAESTHTTHAEADPFDVAGRWLTYAGMFAALGIPLFVRLVVRIPPSALPLRILGALLAVSAVATVALAIRAAVESEGAIAEYLTASRNGQLQVARAAVLALGSAAVLALAARRPGVASAAAFSSAALGMALLVAAGHAAAVSSPVAIVVQFVHVAAAAVWMTGVGGILVLLLLPALLGVRNGTLPLRVAVPRFSALALASIGLVAATGAFASWSQTGTLALFGTEYGRTLALKSSVVVVALSIGAFNFFDGGRGRSWLGGLQMRLSVEFGLAIVVLVIAAVLSRTPPTDDARGVGLEQVPDAFGATIPGLTLDLIPGRPGVNQALVTASGGIGFLPAELTLDRLDAPGTTRIDLVLLDGHAEPMPSMDHMAMPSDSTADQPRWKGDAIILPAGSQWDANVRILSSDGGVELLRQRFSFTMGDETVDAGRLTAVVDPPILIALLLLVGGALAVGLGAGGWPMPRTDPATSRIALVWGGAIGGVLGILIGASQLLGS